MSRVPETAATIGSALAGDHAATFSRAILNILSTDIAEETYAQIIDGLPLARVAMESAADPLPDNHPLLDQHKDLCAGALEKTHEFRKTFDPLTLQLDATLISDFRAASPGSRAFKIRLVELAAVAIHEIAVRLFELDLGRHKGDGLATWVPPEDDIYWEFYDGPWVTLFRHPWYVDYDQYPYGIADGVGFWAESRIFGGVILFDRRGAEGQSDSVWLHPDHTDVSYRIFQLLEEQRLQLLEFLTSDTPDLGLLPIRGDQRNTVREDPEEPIEWTGIYRYRWDRKPLGPDARDGRAGCVWRQFDYPTKADVDRARARASERKDRMWDLEESQR